jgi:DNA-nicking Smr family endonuclease
VDAPSVDLHGLHPDQALRRLEQELHAVRVRGGRELLVITGRGLGNREWKPVLRQRVEAWLRGPEGRRLGVKDFRVVAKGGALEVELG